MTKKHFIALAQQLKAVKPHDEASMSYALDAWYEACNAVATACKRHNPAFNWTRFMDACGVQPRT
jgi:hypothetical protein